MNIALYVIAGYAVLMVMVIGSTSKLCGPIIPGALVEAVAMTLIWPVIVTVLILAAGRLS